MNLTDAQQLTVKRWLDEGLKLAEVQKRLEAEFGLKLTYMEVRMLMADLSLMPKDNQTEAGPAPELSAKGPLGGPPLTKDTPPAGPPQERPADTDEPAPAGGRVSLRIDQITRPGAVVSGSVQFSDGQTAQWYLDQMGRLGLLPAQQGYRPSAADVQEFQMALEGELRHLGM